MINKKQSNFIKLVGIVTMVIDHIGVYLFPLDILRVIGRIAFPIFAYQLGVGYQVTSDKRKYVTNLIFFGLISQVPYSLLRDDFCLNILFSLALGFFAIWSIENRRFYYFLLIIPLSFFVSYGVYGVALILIFYFFKNRSYQSLSFLLATGLYSLYYGLYIQIFSLLSLPVIFKPLLEIKIPKNFFYIFFPTHLAVIYLIKVLLLM